MGLLKKVAPFPLAEAQAHAIVKIISDPRSLDVMQEAVDIITRYEVLRAELGDSVLSIAKAWHVFKDSEQYTYRDDLYAFAGFPVKAQEWEAEMYAYRNLLREVWRELEKTGEALEWVKGVGEGGMHEWIDVMRRMVRKGREVTVREARL
jgi:hypothetical protein